MVFDLRGALLKKQEMESARLADFDFALRVRTMRLLAAALAEDSEELVRMVARLPDASIPEALAKRTDCAPAEIARLLGECRRQARIALIAERGDPAPHRLA